MITDTSSLRTRRPTRRAWLAGTMVATAALTVASCGQQTSQVEVGAPAQASETGAVPGRTDHDQTPSQAGLTQAPTPSVQAPATTGGGTDGMGGGHMGGPGFTEVPGGILLDPPEHGDDHGQDPCSAPVTPEDYQAADKLIADTAAAMKTYKNLDAAKAAGYVQVAPPFGGEGAHWLNPDYMGDGHYLNPNRVESLVYRGNTLEAAMYMMDTADQPGIDVAGCLTPWHLHDNLCIAAGFQIVALTSTGDCPAGSENRPTPRMLHVWLIPHTGGPFAGIFT
ncbi:MAG: hypothetical protein R2754_13810 [Microthrixaceae bacterium]